MARTQQIVLVRHGATAWSVAHKHTGRTDIGLTDDGRRQAEALRSPLGQHIFARVLTSPLRRAAETCRLAGYDAVAQERDDLREWDYGRYEGRTTQEILQERPGWVLWRDGALGGESAADVGQRADRIIAEMCAVQANVLVFAHAHVLRVLAARWLALPPADGGLFALNTGTLSTLGFEHDRPVMVHWNVPAASNALSSI
jgi:broad specificity phosphatase PhoE